MHHHVGGSLGGDEDVPLPADQPLNVGMSSSRLSITSNGALPASETLPKGALLHAGAEQFSWKTRV